MRRMYVVCKRCGYTEKQEIYEPEEAVRKNIRLVPPRCKRCGNMDVELTN